MLKSIHCPLILVILLALIQSCSDGSGKQARGAGYSAVEIHAPDEYCGKAALFNVRTLDGESCGVFEVANDSVYTWLIFTPSRGFSIQSVRFFTGDQSQALRGADSLPDPGIFQHEGKKSQKDNWISRLTAIGGQGCILTGVRVELTGESGPTQAYVYSAQQSLVSYCLQPCMAKGHGCEIAAGKFWTYGRTGEEASGTVSAESFAEAFPEGLVLGCEANQHFESWDAAQRFLKDEGQSPFRREAVAAALALGLDKAGMKNAEKPVGLGMLQVAGGAFRAWSVEELMQEAHAVWGECGSNYTEVQMLEVLQELNQNFAGGNVDAGFLVCPE